MPAFLSRWFRSSVDEVESALAGKGFERSNIGQQLWWTKDCCGEYDAVMVDLSAGDAGNTVASVTVFDSDVQATWFVFLFFGAILLLPGLLLLGHKIASVTSKIEEPVEV